MTPTTDDQLAAVLAEIAEIEGRDGFEGPKIGRRLQLIRISAYADHGDNGEEVFGDRVVGKIGRVCDVRGWIFTLGGPHKTPLGTHYRARIDHHSHSIGVGFSPSIAAARAYRDAIKGGEDDPHII